MLDIPFFSFQQKAESVCSSGIVIQQPLGHKLALFMSRWHVFHHHLHQADPDLFFFPPYVDIFKQQQQNTGGVIFFFFFFSFFVFFFFFISYSVVLYEWQILQQNASCGNDSQLETTE